MIHYRLYIKNPSSHYLYIDAVISDIDTDELTLQLPAWRPGRYELGNFARNIKKVDAYDANNQLLPYRKTTKECWKIKTNGSKEVKITYSYYASELNAGSTYVDFTQLYVNPCNCLMYVPEMMNVPHKVSLEIPDTYFIATSLKKEGKVLTAANFDELADSPFMASAGIKTISFDVKGLKVNLHFNGECHPEEERLKKDFTAFISECIDFFGGIHLNEYHFLFQLTSYKMHHGVEHTANTVIAFGPGNLLMTESYNEFLGLSCHEFFHTWNIKTIRPAEMFPYDYTKENYARTGFVYEGVTTYYGDKLLFSTNIFPTETYFKSFEERMIKHLHSYGRYNLSVGDSSFDNWIDGYNPGVPYRKTNIYDEGCMIAFMLDVLILKNSGNRHSLQTVMKNLYDNFYKKNRGYTEEDFTQLCSEVAGTDLSGFFTGYVYGLEQYEPMLLECAKYIGVEMNRWHSPMFFEKYLGFKAVDMLTHRKVTMIAPYSPAWKAGLSIGDEIFAVNNYMLKADLNNWMHYLHKKDGNCVLTVNSNGRLRDIKIPLKEEGEFFYSYKLFIQLDANDAQKEAYTAWKKSIAG